MPTMTLKNVPDELYEQLKRSAERHRRSLNREAITCLELALGAQHTDPREFLDRVRATRARITKLFVTDADLRVARDEGRR